MRRFHVLVAWRAQRLLALFPRRGVCDALIDELHPNFRLYLACGEPIFELTRKAVGHRAAAADAGDGIGALVLRSA